MLRRLNVSAKVRAVLAVPMVVLIVAGAFITWTAYQDLRLARANSAVLRTLVASEAVTTALRTEVAVSQSATAKSDQLTAARAATDKAVTQVRSTAATVDTSQLVPTSRDQFNGLLQALTTTLPSARAQVDNDSGLVASTYESIFTSQSGFAATFSNDLTDRTLATQVGAHSQILAYTAALSSEQQAGLSLLLAPGAVVANDKYKSAQAATDQASKLAATAVDDLGLSGDPLRAFDSTASKLRSDLANGDASVLSGVTADAWSTAVSNQFKAAAKVDGVVLDKADATASTAERNALIKLIATFSLIFGVGVASWLLASMVARSIVRPLRRLTDTATEVRTQLPRMVEQVAVPGQGPDIELPRIAVESDDEIGKLAGAFNDVNATTIQVAQEQAALRGSIAEMFVNVARRDQVLLNRQLAFVDSLERSEEDPTVLANLFHLDHLATRMRRNAESLLVLAGIDSGRRLRESMPLSDVIRTASSEIEQYDRVELDLTVDPHMLGFNALPAAHMLAELLENASVFSEPDTPVEVSTGMSGQYVTVSVLDHGIGMTDGELAAVNEKLHSTAPGDALGAQRLGLFVVARLARRLGAQVTVQHAPNGPGAETIVRFPVALFAGLEPEAPAQPMVISPEVEAVIESQELPEVRAVDLAALTDGATEQGLPRRRQGVVPEDLDSGAFVLPPAVTAAELHTDMVGTSDGWSPMIVSSDATGLPTRRRDAEADVPEVPLLDLTPNKPVAPESRAGLFTGFRGWSRQQDEPAVPGVDEAPAASFEQAPAFDQAPAATVEQAPAVAPDVAAAGVEESAAEQPAAAGSPLVPRPRTRTRRGAHAAPSTESGADVPFGYTQDEVASWHTGSIPVVSTGDEDGDWPSPTWDNASWQPAGLFTRPTGADGPLVPAFDPIALEPDEDEQPYVPVALEPSADLAPFGAPSWPAADESAAVQWPGAEQSSEPAWATPDAAEEPVWQPVMDLSDSPLGAGGRAPVEPVAPVAPVEEPSWAPFAAAEPVVETPVEPVWQPFAVAPVDPVAFEQDDEPAWQPVMDLSDTPIGAAPAAQPAPADWNVSTWPNPSEPTAPAAAPTFAAGPAPAAVEPDAPAWPSAPAAVEPDAPAWPSVPGPGVQAAAAAASAPAPAETGRKRRFGLFGRKPKTEAVAVVPTAAPAAPVAPTAGLPAWNPTDEPAVAALPAPAEPTWSAPTEAPMWGTPTPEPTFAPAEASWTPPPAPVEPVSRVDVPAPTVPAAAETRSWNVGADLGAEASPAGKRVGTLDDDVAAMLALRSDIEEQALSELSQLSAYRPSMGGSTERLTRRVPTAVPAAAPAAGSHPIRRDADELRSRLASFQSGTTRGRRAPVDTEGHES